MTTDAPAGPAPDAPPAAAPDPTATPGTRAVITILGTGHVFNLRARVQEEIFRRHPEVVCIELDPLRYRALKAQARGETGSTKNVPVFYRLLASFQTRIAGEYGVKAGDEMLAASDAAQDLRVPLALIDVDAQRTFRRTWQEMGYRERLRLAGSIVGSVFMPSKTVESQVEEMEENYDLYFTLLGDKFPTLKRILLDERNEHMAKALQGLATRHANVIAVLGDGHVDGVKRILEEGGLDVDVVRLKALRVPRDAPPAGDTTASASFTYSLDE